MSVNITGGNASGAHLGDILWWKAPALPTFPPAVLAAAASSIAALVPAAPEAALIFRRAAAQARAGGKFDVRRLCDSAQEIAYSVASVTADAQARQSRYAHAATVTWTPTGGGIATTTAPEGQVVVDVYAMAYGKLGKPEWNELGKAFVKASRAISLRTSGGVYWLPAGSRSKELRELGDLFGAFGGAVGIAPQFATEEGVTALGGAAKVGVLGDLRTLAAEIQGFTERTRTSTMDAKLLALKDLRERAGWVCDLLKEGADGILNQIAPLEAAVVAALLGDPTTAQAIDLDHYGDGAEFEVPF